MTNIIEKKIKKAAEDSKELFEDIVARTDIYDEEKSVLKLCRNLSGYLDELCIKPSGEANIHVQHDLNKKINEFKTKYNEIIQKEYKILNKYHKEKSTIYLNLVSNIFQTISEEYRKL